jgi:RND family efflux transporter MFP subunit
MAPRLKQFTLIVAILAAAVGLATVMVKMKPEPPKKEVESRAPLVDTLVLEPMTTRFTISSQGTVRPRTETVISAEVSGTITEVSPHFVAGGVFSAGEMLMRIDPVNYRVAVEQAEALVKQRQIEFDGASTLRSQGYRAETEYASSATALASARAELVRARRNLERTTINVPYDGMVRSREANIGQFVSPGVRLGTVFATDYAEVRLPLTDEDLAFVDLPDPVAVAAGEADEPNVTLSAVQEGILREWQARIIRSEGVVDEDSRVTYAVARVADPYQREGDGVPLPMGTFVTATIEGRRVASVFRVPREILRRSDELMFVDANDTLRLRSVDIVHADADFAYIGGGAEAGERVVTTALESPFNGMVVRTEREQSPDTGRVASENGSLQ